MEFRRTRLFWNVWGNVANFTSNLSQLEDAPLLELRRPFLVPGLRSISPNSS